MKINYQQNQSFSARKEIKKKLLIIVKNQNGY